MTATTLQPWTVHQLATLANLLLGGADINRRYVADRLNDVLAKVADELGQPELDTIALPRSAKGRAKIARAIITLVAVGVVGNWQETVSRFYEVDAAARVDTND
jgi:hypothetical protein